MGLNFGAGLHVAAGQPVNTDAYDGYIGRWSRLFVPAVLEAAEIAAGDRVIDVSTGTGEAARMILPIVGPSGLVIGADLSLAMLEGARRRLDGTAFYPAVADGQILPFGNVSADAVICQLGLQFFADPASGLAEFRRVLRPGRCAAICVVSSADRAPMWGILAEVLGRFLPEQRDVLQLTFALSDAGRVEQLLAGAGFRDVHVERQTRSDVIAGFDAYWDPIETGTGSIPQAYLSLCAADRRAVREEVTARLLPFASNGMLNLSVEMLIGKGRA